MRLHAIIFDKKSKNTVAGIGDIEDSASKYTEVTVSDILRRFMAL